MFPGGGGGTFLLVVGHAGGRLMGHSSILCFQMVDLSEGSIGVFTTLCTVNEIHSRSPVKRLLNVFTSFQLTKGGG